MQGFGGVYAALLLAASSFTANAASFHAERNGPADGGSLKAEPLKRTPTEAPHMKPGVHPRLNKKDPVHLLSRKTSTLFYTQGGNIYLEDAAMVATLDAAFHWETVILDHSDFISSVSCQPQQMNIKLSSLNAFNSAKANWTHDETIVFVSSSPSCHTKYPGQFAYFNASSVSFNQKSLSVAATGSQINVTEAIHEFNVEWGLWNAMQTSSSSSVVVSSPTAKLNNNAALPKTSSSTTSKSTSKTSTSSSSKRTSSSTSTTRKSSSTTAGKSSSTTAGKSSSTTSGKSSSTTAGKSSSSTLTTSSSSTSGVSTTSSAGSSSTTSSSSLSSTTSGNSSTSTTTSSGTSATAFDLLPPLGTGICAQPPNPIPSPFSPYFKKLNCDNNFDQGVDDFLTYFSDVSNLQQYLNLWAPNTGIQVSDVQGSGLRFRRGLERRESFGDFLGKCVHVLVEVAEDVIDAVADALSYLRSLADAILPTWHPSISFKVPVDVSAPAFELDDSPWGDGYSIYEWHPGQDGDINYGLNLQALAKLTGADELLTFQIDGVTQLPQPGIVLWCVECHLIGEVIVTGQATFTFPFGITDLLVKLNGNLTANIQLGLDAYGEYTATPFSDRIFEVGVPGWSIPEIIAVGPFLTLDFDAELKVQTVGQFLAGAELTWTNLGIDIDFLTPISSKSHGYTPQVKPIFKASGNITATASLGMPLALSIGIDILDGTFEESIALTDRPAIEAVAEYSINPGEPVYADGMNPCEGILYYADLVNEVTLDIFDAFKYDLGSWHGDKFLSGCDGDNGINTVQEALNALPAGQTQAGCTLVEEVFENDSFEDNGGSTFPWMLDGGGANIGLTNGEDDTHDGSNSLQFSNEWVRDCGTFCFGSCGFLGFCEDCCAPPKQDWTAEVKQNVTLCTYAQYDFQLWARAVNEDGLCNITDVFVKNLDDPDPDLSFSIPLQYSIMPVTANNKDQFPLTNDDGIPISIPSKNNIKSYNVQVGFHILCSAALDFDIRVDDITLTPDSSAYSGKKRKRQELPVVGSSSSSVSPNNTLPTVSLNNALPILPTGTNAPGLSAINAVPTIGFTTAAPGLPAANAAPTLAPANDAPAFGYVAQANAVSGTYVPGDPVPTATAVLLGPADYNFPPFDAIMASATLGPVGAAAPTDTVAGTGTGTGTSAAGSSGSAPFTGWSSLTQLDGTNVLAAADDGNLYLSGAGSSVSAPGTQFYSEGSIAYQDEQSRLFHYYPETMTAYGVSRIRVSSIMDTPLTAQLITLAPLSTPNGIAYVAADTANNNFFLMTCTAAHWSGSKVFLVDDVTNGANMLLAGDVQWIVTGNNVTACEPLILTSAASPLTPQ